MADGLNKWCLYIHTTPNNKKYIGITSRSLSKRWRKGNGYIGCSLFYNAIIKYGWDNIKHEILFDGLTETEAKKLEIELITKHRTNDRKYGYNITSGGDGSLGREVTKETREKMSKSWTTDKREKMSSIHSGKGNPMYGTLSPSRRKVECITTGEVFDSISKASKKYNRSPTVICEHLKGIQKYAGKLEDGTPLVWRYLDEHRGNRGLYKKGNT